MTCCSLHAGGVQGSCAAWSAMPLLLAVKMTRWGGSEPRGFTGLAKL